jgi:hypothetical protein
MNGGEWCCFMDENCWQSACKYQADTWHEVCIGATASLEAITLTGASGSMILLKEWRIWGIV